MSTSRISWSVLAFAICGQPLMAAGQQTSPPPECVQMKAAMADPNVTSGKRNELYFACVNAQRARGFDVGPRIIDPDSVPLNSPAPQATRGQDTTQPTPQQRDQRQRDASGPQSIMSVFGFKLGERLTLKTCSTMGIGAPDLADLGTYTLELQVLRLGHRSAISDETCRWHPDVMDGARPGGILAQLLTGDSDTSVPVGKVVMVRLGRDRCPDWVQAASACELAMTIKDNVVAGVTFYSGGYDFSDTIERALTAKYGAPKTDRKPTVCQVPGGVSINGFTRRWESQGLVVRYYSNGGLRCNQGRVSVQTEGLHKALIDAGRASETREISQPQM